MLFHEKRCGYRSKCHFAKNYIWEITAIIEKQWSLCGNFAQTFIFALCEKFTKCYKNSVRCVVASQWPHSEEVCMYEHLSLSLLMCISSSVSSPPSPRCLSLCLYSLFLSLSLFPCVFYQFRVSPSALLILSIPLYLSCCLSLVSLPLCLPLSLPVSPPLPLHLCHSPGCLFYSSLPLCLYALFSLSISSILVCFPLLSFLLCTSHLVSPSA